MCYISQSDYFLYKYLILYVAQCFNLLILINLARKEYRKNYHTSSDNRTNNESMGQKTSFLTPTNISRQAGIESNETKAADKFGVFPKGNFFCIYCDSQCLNLNEFDLFDLSKLYSQTSLTVHKALLKIPLLFSYIL